MFPGVSGEEAKGLGGQKTQTKENTGEEKNENNTCNVRVSMPSNLCLSQRCSINTTNT